MILLNQYSNTTEAYIDKGFLESNGVKCEIISNAMSEIFPAPGAGNGSIDLYVADQDFEMAKKLLFERN